MNVVVEFVDANQSSTKKRIPFATACCKCFFNMQHLLVQLGTGERALFDYLCEKMDEDKNTVPVSRGRVNTGFVRQ